MKKILAISSLLFFLLLSAGADAQKLKDWADAKKKEAKDKVNAKLDRKTSEGIDEAVNTPEKVIKKKNEKKDGNKTNTSPADNNSTNSTDNSQANSPTENNAETPTGKKPATLQFYSKFDFVPGETIVAIDDFSQDAMGDFPARWNTNSSGDLVNVEGKPGKWLSLAKKGVFMPEFFTKFPDNFTLQFEIMCNPEFSYYSTQFGLAFAKLAKPKDFTDWDYWEEKRNGTLFTVFPVNPGVYSTDGAAEYKIFENGKVTMKNEITTSQFSSKSSNYAKVSVWRQKQRIRIYLNEEKIFDLPRGMTLPDYNTLVFTLGDFHQADKDRYLISNLRLAVGAPDTRNKLITEGKFVTRGILFDINSDKIKPESYGAIKDIATVLKENTDVKVKIVGHTDSDGDDNSNLELSKRRAGAIKTALSSEFGIDASRLQTDGMGETQPVDKNNTPEGKANNRRVEFIKT